MCTVCGCNQTTSNHEHSHDHHVSDNEHKYEADEVNTHNHGPSHTRHHYGNNESGLSIPGFTQNKLVEIEQNILSKNNSCADDNRSWLTENEVLALNILSSPGAGKTTLLVESIERLSGSMPIGVIEGDQETSNDADRIRRTGANAIQINTGRGCHLDAHMVGHALSDLKIPPRSGAVVFVENVGNLVCPALFDLGEDNKVVILSATEGEDKPLKYPDMFEAADLLIISKTDLLPYVDFDVSKAVDYAKRINPSVEVLLLSTKSGQGIDSWISWIKMRSERKCDQSGFARGTTTAHR